MNSTYPLTISTSPSLNNLYSSNSHSEIPTPLPHPFLSGAPQPPLELQMVDPLPNRLAISRSLRCRLLPVPPPHPDPIDQVALLGLVTESTSLVGARGTGGTMDDGELTIFPATDAGDELEDVGLFLGVKLGQVFVGAHLRVS